MRKLIVLMAMAVALVCSPAYADFTETTLDTPEVTSVTKYRLAKFVWEKTQMIAQYEKLDGSGNVLETVSCLIRDWDEETTPAVPGSCSDPAHENQANCEGVGETWTPEVPAVITPRPDFTNLHTSTVGAGQVGNLYRSIITTAMNNTCKGAHYLNITGTE